MYRYYVTTEGEKPFPGVAEYIHGYGANGSTFEGLGTVRGYVEYKDELPEEVAASYGLVPGPIPHYYTIDEGAAKRAKEAYSFSDYIRGSETEHYRAEVDEFSFVGFLHKQKVDPMYHERIDGLVDTFARRLADNLNQSFSIQASCPSILIAGASNFPVQKKRRQNERMDKNMKEWSEIHGLRSKLLSIGTGGISSDDPKALEKLRKKRDELVKIQERMKAANAAVRMKDTEAGDAKLTAMGFSAAAIKELRTPDYCGRVGYPSYELSNNSANIRRINERIEALEKRRSEPAPEGWTFDGGEVVANTEENRLQIIFDEKPDAETRENLKSNGFRWAPSKGAWQRQLTENAIRAAKRMEILKPA